MFEQLKSLEDRYEKLNELLSDPEIGSDPDKLREYSKEQAGLADSVTAYRKYKTVTDELADAKEMLELESDDDMVDMVKMEIEELTDRKEKLEEEIKFLLIQKTLMMIKTLLLKFGQQQVETKLLYLQAIYSVCIQDMLNIISGKPK